ncbi:MAG: GxxExxY protein [Ignavibacteriales bacterium]|nr:GxxExxY protein [Ignavibacteriales bacterium]
MDYRPIDPALNEVTGKIIDAAYNVHSTLGAGLLESVYQKCMLLELAERKLYVQRELVVPIRYKGYDIDANYRIDLLVENEVVVELKSVDQMLPVFEAQLLTYMKLANKRIGLLINFNVPVIKKGIKRIIL